MYPTKEFPKVHWHSVVALRNSSPNRSTSWSAVFGSGGSQENGFWRRLHRRWHPRWFAVWSLSHCQECTRTSFHCKWRHGSWYHELYLPIDTKHLCFCGYVSHVFRMCEPFRQELFVSSLYGLVSTFRNLFYEPRHAEGGSSFE